MRNTRMKENQVHMREDFNNIDTIYDCVKTSREHHRSHRVKKISKQLVSPLKQRFQSSAEIRMS